MGIVIFHNLIYLVWCLQKLVKFQLLNLVSMSNSSMRTIMNYSCESLKQVFAPTLCFVEAITFFPQFAVISGENDPFLWSRVCWLQQVQEPFQECYCLWETHGISYYVIKNTSCVYIIIRRWSQSCCPERHTRRIWYWLCQC